MIRLTKPEQIHQVIAELRLAAGKSQRGLAADLRIRGTQINRFENEGQRPNLASLIALAGALGYDVALVKREDAQALADSDGHCGTAGPHDHGPDRYPPGGCILRNKLSCKLAKAACCDEGKAVRWPA